MKQVLSITDIFPFENRIRYFQMPAVRLIGKSMRHTSETDIAPIPLFWKEYHENHAGTVKLLPQIIRTTVAWIGEYDPGTRQYTYLICVICPAGTPVPPGLDHRDMQPTLMAHGTLSDNPPAAHDIGRFDEALRGEGFVRTDGWSCEFYPVQEKLDCCLLFTVEAKDK